MNTDLDYGQPSRRPRRDPDGNYTKKQPRRHKGEPYVPGSYDRLLAPKEHRTPEELTGVSFEVTPSGVDMVEHTRSGHNPRHHIRDFPASIDLLLPNGEMVWVEIRSMGAPEPWVEYRTPEEIAADRIPAIARFGDCEED